MANLWALSQRSLLICPSMGGWKEWWKSISCVCIRKLGMWDHQWVALCVCLFVYMNVCLCVCEYMSGGTGRRCSPSEESMPCESHGGGGGIVLLLYPYISAMLTAGTPPCHPLLSGCLCHCCALGYGVIYII